MHWSQHHRRVLAAIVRVSQELGPDIEVTYGPCGLFAIGSSAGTGVRIDNALVGRAGLGIPLLIERYWPRPANFEAVSLAVWRSVHQRSTWLVPGWLTRFAIISPPAESRLMASAFPDGGATRSCVR